MKYYVKAKLLIDLLWNFVFWAFCFYSLLIAEDLNNLIQKAF